MTQILQVCIDSGDASVESLMFLSEARDVLPQASSRTTFTTFISSQLFQSQVFSPLVAGCSRTISPSPVIVPNVCISDLHSIKNPLKRRD